MDSEYPNFAMLKDSVEEFSLEKRKLVLEILSNGDDKVLKLIQDNHEAFVALVETQGGTAGMKWDDLIIKFEWTFHVEEILQN